MPAHPTQHASVHPPRNWLWAALAAGGRRLWSFRWTFGIPMATLLLLAALYAVRKADYYEAVALVRAVEQSGGRSVLPGEREPRAKQLVAMAFDRILTGPNLTSASKRLEDYVRDPAVVAPPEIAARYVIEKKGEFHFTVAALDEDPELAAHMVNELLDAALDGEKERIQEKAKQRIEFWDRTTREKTFELENAQRDLGQFDIDNAETLPEKAVTVEQNIIATESAIRELEDQRREADRMIATLTATGEDGAVLAPALENRDLAAKRRERDELDRRRKEARRNLELMEQRLQPRHPDVVRMRSLVTVLERDLEALDAQILELANESQMKDTREQGGEASPTDLSALPPALAEQYQRRDAAIERIEELEGELQTWRTRRNQLPITAKERQDLLEKVDAAERELDAHLREKSRATLWDEFVKNSDGVDGLIGDVGEDGSPTPAEIALPYVVEREAQAPSEPAGPDRTRYLLTGLALGAALGYGLVLLRKRFHLPAISRAEDIYDLVTGAMIVSVPLLPDGSKKPAWWSRIRPHELMLGAWVAFCIVATVVLLGAQAGSIDLPNSVVRILGIRA